MKLIIMLSGLLAALALCQLSITELQLECVWDAEKALTMTSRILFHISRDSEVRVQALVIKVTVNDSRVCWTLV